eukprot:TRINITY_DN6000_c0_g1_i4.p1 TRINITY_DN6000_c0_g1~~TRINITY_DN6000_c0_g1_i4.p1  ORF type:complete len:284 (+),score=30.25 TRINITY_DN6000_c0_g1_i4:55-906(+)
MRSILLLFSFLVFAHCDYCGPWIPIDINTIPVAQPDDIWEVSYLVSPLLYCDYLYDFSYLRGYHAGLGLKNLRTGYSFSLNYDATPTFTGALLPVIENNTLIWENFGALFLYNGINDTYWNSFNQVIAKLNSVQFNGFMKFLATANETYPYYNFWAIYPTYPGKPWIENNECFQFVWDCFRELKNLGVQFTVTELKQSFIVMFTPTMPEKLNMSLIENQIAVYKFYYYVESEYKEFGIVGALEILWKIISTGVFFVRADTDYYKVFLDQDYPFDTFYVEVPLP